MDRPAEAVIRVGTRTSKLALWQTHHVADLLRARWPHLRCELQPVVTLGDRRLDRALPEIGGKGLFTAELEEGLRAGEVDIAVHSLKDLPVEDAAGLTVGAVLSREDVRDVLVAREADGLAALPVSAVVGTSSLRRQAQLLARRPDLVVKTIRGNVDTRIRKVLDGDYDATILAGAGVRRLGLEDQIAEWLDLLVMLPAPGQGAIAVQCRADDRTTLGLLTAIEDIAARTETYAERRLLWRLGGGCSAPVAALGRWDRVSQVLSLTAFVGSVDGREVFTASVSGASPEEVADAVADELLHQGAGAVLSRPPSQSASRAPLPLHGKRVVVTRPAGQSASLIGKLAEAGAVPIEAPGMRIASLADTTEFDAALHALHEFTWVIFTSTNAVEVFWSRYREIRGPDSPWPGPKVAAVGTATEAALTAVGLQVDFVPDEQLGQLLAEKLPMSEGAQVLVPRSALGREDLPGQLAARGARVRDIAIYTSTPASLAPEVQQELARGFDVVTFTSGSTVRGFAAAVQGDTQVESYLQKAVIACIGPATAQVASEVELSVHIVAQDHSVDGLVEALIEYFRR